MKARRENAESDRGTSASSKAVATMMDVVFLLLIFFLLQPFKQEENKLRAPLPREGYGPPRPSEIPPIPVELRLRHLGGGRAACFVDSKPAPADLRGLTNRLAEQSGGEQRPVILVTDAPVDFGYVVTAMDACAAAGLSRVLFGYPD